MHDTKRFFTALSTDVSECGEVRQPLRGSHLRLKDLPIDLRLHLQVYPVQTNCIEFSNILASELARHILRFVSFWYAVIRGDPSCSTFPQGSDPVISSHYSEPAERPRKEPCELS